MKKILLSLALAITVAPGANAMSFERAQAEALYLTDKMAYELNLNDQQYDDAYEINLDYFLRIDSPSDLYGSYYGYRLGDLRCILHDWQYSLFLAADYFVRPLAWRAGGWFFPIYGHYNRGFFYFGRPSVWVSYRGGHSRFHHRGGFYVDRRPHWSGGLRGRDMHRPSPGMGGRIHGNRPVRGHGYHFDLGGSRRGGTEAGRHHDGGMRPGERHGGTTDGNGFRSHGGGRGNSFDGSSSRMSGERESGNGTGFGSRGRGGEHHSMSGGGYGEGRSMGGRSAGFSGGSRGSSPSRSAGFGGSSRSSSPSFSGGSRSGGYGGGGRSGGFGGGGRSGGGRGGRR